MRVTSSDRTDSSLTRRPRRAQTLWAIVVLVGLEILLIAFLTAIGVRGVPAVVIVIVFALVERIAYVRWFKRPVR